MLKCIKIIFFEPNYGDSKNELQIMIEKRPQIEKVLQTLTGATFFLVFSGGRGPDGGGSVSYTHLTLPTILLV